ncbi:hypothetical protein ABWH91_08600 [Phycisphaerales bacterium ac7]
MPGNTAPNTPPLRRRALAPGVDQHRGGTEGLGGEWHERSGELDVDRHPIQTLFETVVKECIVGQAIDQLRVRLAPRVARREPDGHAALADVLASTDDIAR